MKKITVWYRVGHWVSTLHFGFADDVELSREHVLFHAKLMLRKRYGRKLPDNLQFWKIEGETPEITKALEP